MKKLTLSVLALLALASLVYAEGTTPSAALMPEEREVLSRLHIANQKEIKAGSIAIERGQTKDVRRFGQHLVDDHTAADAKLTALAKRKNVTLTEPTSSQLDTLRSVKDDDFDRTFATIMVKDHDDAIKLVQDAQAKCKDPDVLSHLKETLPTLRKHREMAQKLQDPSRADAKETPRRRP